MKLKPQFHARLNFQDRLHRFCLQVCFLTLTALFIQTARPADILWTGVNGDAHWTNNADWVGGVAPGAGDIAEFCASGSIINNTNININVAPSATEQVGEVVIDNNVGATFRITANSGAVNPTTLNLNGVGGILVSNGSSTYQVFFTNATAAPTPSLNIGIGNSGGIYANSTVNINPPHTLPADASGGEIVFYSVITGSGSITNIGPGIVDFAGVNTYSGSTTLANGSLYLGTSGTIGNGTGPVYFTGGNLETGGSSTSRITTNTFVINTSGNAYIYNVSGSAGTRVFAFSNNIVGINGTLVFGNANTTVGEYMDVQFMNGFTFNLPVVVGDNLGDAYSDNYPSTYSELQLANGASTAPQIFNGTISGDGPIFRGSLITNNLPFASVGGNNGGGVTIFTGNNTYSGGTSINYGTLYANNTAGSALGSGSVTVTNKGVLGGNGFVTASTTVYNGGTVQPGSTNTSVGNLSMNGGLTFYPGANYTVQVASATGNPGTAWDVLTCAGGWTDAGNGSTLININLTSTGAVTGWNSTVARSWLIITNNGGSTSFNAANWNVVSTAFAANNTLAGTFSVSTDANGDLLLNYTPTSGNLLINVPSGSVAQGGVSPTNYPILTGLNSVTKVGSGEVILTNSLNSYQGATYIFAGTASAAVNSTTSGGAFGASTTPLMLGNTTGVSSNATLNIDQSGVTIANAVTVQAGNAGTKTIGTTLTSGGATNSGNVTLNDNVTLSAATGGLDAFLGNFSGTGGITFAGGGTYVMDGLGSYAGTTTLTGGTLDLNASALGTNTFTISATSTLDNTSGANVTLANNPPQNWNADFNFGGAGNLNLGTGAVTMSANRILTVSNAVLTVGGTIAGTGGLTVVGPGELSLTAATNSTYAGGTTNLGAILAINATGTFGTGTGPLVFSGGNLLDTGGRSGLPISNPVIINTNTRIYGNSTDISAPNRFLPFTGGFTVNNGATVYIDNVGSATTIFNVTLQGTNFTTVNWPIVIGDSSFDASGALNVLNLLNDNTTPVQTINSMISGPGSLIRGANALNTGGTSILTQQNTFTGGVALDSGYLGVGASSTVSGGAIVSGPLGTGQLTFGNSNNETNLTIFAAGGPAVIANKIFLNGNTNITFGGTNNLQLTGDINSGNAAKSLTVAGGITVTFSGAITNTGTSGGGPLTKLGGGTLIFAGTNTYIGTTAINAGTLLVSGALNTNTVTTRNGGTFGGTGSLGGNLTYNTGAQAYLFKSAGLPDSPLMVASNLTINSAADIVTIDLGGTTTLGAGTYTLLTYGGTLTGTFNATPVLVNGSLAGGNIATIDTSTPNEVNLVVATGSLTPPAFPAGALTKLSSGNISLVSTGALGASYRLWASTNLIASPVTSTWTLLSSGTVTASPFTNFDLTATNYPQRFYLFTTP